MKKLFILITILLVFFTGTVRAVGEEPQQNNNIQYLQLKIKLERLLDDKEGTYGIYFIDLNSGKSVGINEDNEFYAASTVKLPLNLYLYEKIASEEVNPETKLKYEEDNYEGGTGLLKEESPGESYSIDLLSKYSIKYSDNIATNILMEYLGSNNVKDYMRAKGGILVDNKKNITCPKDMALYMQELLRFAEKHPEHGNKLLTHLENTVFNERIPKKLPEDIKIAHKIGNWPPQDTYNDIGCVKHHERPYIISIFSKNVPSREDAYSTIQEISKAVYEYQDNPQQVKLLLNNNKIVTDTPPVILNNRVLVPIRAIASTLNAKVYWNGEKQNIIISKFDKRIFLQIGNSNANVNGTEILLDSPPQIMNNRTMVPVRFVSEALNTKVNWNNDNKAVEIYTKS